MKEIVLGGGAPKKQPAPRAPKRRRRTGRQTLNYLLLLIVAAVIMVTLSVTVLFNINSIVTDGVTKYAPQSVIAASGVKEGDNLLRISEHAVRKKLLDRFAYFEDVSLRRALPDKLVIEVTEAVVLGACETEDGFVIVGEKGRILQTEAPAPPDGAMSVYGMYIYEPEVGRFLGQGFDEEHKEQQEQEQAAYDSLTYLVKAVKETGFRNITLADFSDPYNMAIVYDGRVLIELGSAAELPDKLQFVSYVLEKKLPEGYQGVLDASYYATSKEIVESAKDITLELQKRHIGDSPEPEELEVGEGADEVGGEGTDEAANPELAVKPKKDDGSSSSQADASAGDGASSKEDDPDAESQASSMIGPYTPDEIAVKPLPEGASKPEENKGNDASSTAPSGGDG